MDFSALHLSPAFTGYASVGAIGLGALLAFRIARKIVALGYFVLYFFMGFGIVYSASAYATRSFDVPLSMPIIGGLAFAAVASAIRAKLMRIVSAIMMVALFSLAGKYWSQYANARQPGGDKSEQEKQQQLAMQALTSAKHEFGDILKLLPKDAHGKIKAGWITGAELEKMGIPPRLQKVNEKPSWHTWLTGLYEEERQDLGIWTPGGSVIEAKDGLALRPKGRAVPRK